VRWSEHRAGSGEKKGQGKEAGGGEGLTVRQGERQGKERAAMTWGGGSVSGWGNGRYLPGESRVGEEARWGASGQEVCKREGE
jgi:hypothetical protein